MENNHVSASPNIQDPNNPIQSTTPNTHPAQPQSTSQPPVNPQYQPHPSHYQQQQQQQQYAAYIQQQQHRYYAQQQYLLQQQRQQQYASYWQSVLKQRHQHQYAQYYQQIAQQYGYSAMLQAINQNNNQNMSAYNQSRNNHSNGPIMLSSEEQPSLIASDNPKYKRRRRRKKRKRSEIENVDTINDSSNDSNSNYIRTETVSIDIKDDDGLGLDKDSFDKHTLINQNENLPNIDTEFDQWLYFTKNLWKRQRKYKNFVVPHINNNKKNTLDLTTDSISTSEEHGSSSISEDSLPQTPIHPLQINSAFLKDRARMNLKKQKVLKNKSVINIMIKMGLAPPWNQMLKYKKWTKCYKWNQKQNK